MECPICYSGECQCHTLVCGHKLCKTCIKKWYTTSCEPNCPMCRAPLNFKGLHKMKDKWEEEATERRIEEHYGNAIDNALESWSIFPTVCMYALLSIERNLTQMYLNINNFTDDVLEYYLDYDIIVSFPTNPVIVYPDFGTIEHKRSLLVSKYSRCANIPGKNYVRLM